MKSTYGCFTIAGDILRPRRGGSERYFMVRAPLSLRLFNYTQQPASAPLSPPRAFVLRITSP